MEAMRLLKITWIARAVSVMLSGLALIACSSQPKTIAPAASPANSAPNKAVMQKEQAAQQQGNKIQQKTDTAQDAINQSEQQIQDAEKAAGGK
jgi:hypothetical protein